VMRWIISSGLMVLALDVRLGFTPIHVVFSRE
jgi:hypothetical protein